MEIEEGALNVGEQKKEKSGQRAGVRRTLSLVLGSLYFQVEHTKSSLGVVGDLYLH